MRKRYLFPCPSHFEAVLKDGRGRAKATSPKRKRAFFVGKVGFALTEKREAFSRPKMTQS
jgi:hypothetical protein